MADSTTVFTAGQRITDSAGRPILGGSVEFYNAGTDTPKEVFADFPLATSLGAVVYTDSAGDPVTASGGTSKTLVYTDTAPYKVIARNSAGAVVFSHDDCLGAIVGGGSGSSSSGITQDEADLRYNRYANALAAAASVADGDKFTGFDSSEAGNAGFDWAVLKSSLLSQWQASGAIFPAATRLAFQSATPPVGWVKETNAAYHNATVCFTTGPTAATSGTQPFTSVFTPKTPTGTIGSTTLAESQMPSHSHNVIADTDSTFSASGIGAGSYVAKMVTTAGAEYRYVIQASATPPTLGIASYTGGGGSHTHTFTGNAIDMSVKYVEFCIGSKS